MPLANGYGVVIGTKHDYYRDPPDNFGRYYHGNLVVHAPLGNYHCAIDVDPKSMPDGIQWRIVTLRPVDVASLKALPDGWHPLASTPSSGAMDYPRSPVLHPPVMIYTVRYDSCLSRLLGWIRWNPPWNSGTGFQALTDLEGILNQGVRFYVFGEPFNTGLGVHNVHQNQGDPVGGGHDAENAIWQDGATIVETADGRFLAFLNKFKTQSFRTDDFGRPA
ncbi:MAG TPA: YukJ family protein [Propionicimonas sp.]|nr:YukJ family protein [Propionicimonas sp.]